MIITGLKKVKPLLLLLLLIALSSSKSISQQAGQRPHILWIVSEDNSPFIGAYGDSFATTPTIDRLASEGVLYWNAFSNAPVCAPSRSALIMGVYPNSLGTEHMRSNNPVPSFMHFFPKYLKDMGYYTSNNAKKDYNTIDQPDVWDESSISATYKNRKAGQPFFAVINIGISHESAIHTPIGHLRHDPDKVPIPPYHPPTPEIKRDWAFYYDRVEEMDKRVGDILAELERDGLSDSTIVFYYSDHGGVLGRSKRFVYESGLHVPLIIRFPEAYRHLAPSGAGTTTDRIVSFVDFAPTVLSLAGAAIPEYMQGKAFLGPQETQPRKYAFAFRGRMGERTDMSRSVRDDNFRYIRNYMPHRIYGQYLEYQWKARSMASWEKAFHDGKLNEVQAKFWLPKPVEELYDVKADPHNVMNLAEDPRYQAVLEEMRKENERWMKEVGDVGFIPEPILIEKASSMSLYEYARSGNFDFEKVLRVAEKASARDEEEIEVLMEGLSDRDPVIRYWSAVGFAVLGKEATGVKDALLRAAKDSEPAVQIAAAEALFGFGEKAIALEVLNAALAHKDRMVRLQALNVLETLGEEAAPALENIHKLVSEDLQDHDYDIRAANRLAEKLKHIHK